MCDFSESIHSGFLQRAVNQETVMIWWIWVKPSVLDVSYDLHTAYESWPTFSLIGIFEYSDFLPKEMTPIAWKIPLRISKKPSRSPRRFGDTLPPWIMTVIMMTDMLINASVDESLPEDFKHWNSKMKRRHMISYFGNVTVKRKRKGNSEDENNYDCFSICQEPQKRSTW